MKSQTQNKTLLLSNNQIRNSEISESKNKVIKEERNEENSNNICKKNKIFSQTFSNNIRKPNYKKNNSLNLNIQNINNGVNVNIILCVTKRDNKKINKEDEEEKIPKASPYTFKYFCNTANKKSFGRALSTNNSIKPSNQEIESNFIKLSKDANIYTANADYITNKKLLLFDKYDFPNNKYKPNRANLFDMTSIPHSKNHFNTVYKTTKFRGGRMFFFDNKKTLSVNENKSNNNIFINKKPLYIQDLEKYELKTQNEFYKKYEKHKYIDNSYQNKKRHPPSNSLYKELMTKKNEIYDTFVNNKEAKTDKIYSPIFKPIFPLSSSESDEGKEINKKNIKNEELIGYSNLLYKKKNDGIIPITFPLICSNSAICDTISQRNRFENIMETFIRLKSLIENDKKLGKDNETDYIIEFILNKNIDKKYINHEYINNFLDFLKCKKLPIDTNKSLKENIILALNFDKSNKNKDLYTNEDNINYNNNNINIYKKIKTEEKINEIKNNKNIFNSKPLEFDLKRQKQLFTDKNYKNNFELRDALKKELDLIEYDVNNKQIKIKQIENNLNLLPFEENYYYRKNMNKKSKIKKKENVELLLISPQGYYKALIPNNIEINNKEKNKNKIKDNLFDSNERLYYNWYKNKNGGEVQNYIKNSKLTEYIIYNRTKDKIIKNKLKEIAEKQKLRNNNNINK